MTPRRFWYGLGIHQGREKPRPPPLGMMCRATRPCVTTTPRVNLLPTSTQFIQALAHNQIGGQMPERIDFGFIGTVAARPVFRGRSVCVSVKPVTLEKMATPDRVLQLLGGTVDWDVPA